MDTKKYIDQICSRLRDASFAVEYWDGDKAHYGPGPAEFTLRLKNKATVEGLFSHLKLHLPEAYTAGDIQVEGDLQRFIRLVFLVDPEVLKLSTAEKAMLAATALRQRNRLGQSKENIAHHYDLGNDFFKLWLDKQLLYSCAYFRTPGDDLDTAQEQKLRHLCLKLRLSRGERLLDIGCGWGALVIHAARSFGVRALGITLSEEQQRGAQDRVRALGLQDQVEIRLQDYRELRGEEFDKVVSVGMFEHVGREFIPEYMRQTARLLRPGGTGVLHTMGRMQEGPVNPWILKHIFPGMYLPTLGELSQEMGETGLNIIDVENLRMHYARTLDQWAERFEASVDEVQRMFDERFVRMWRMYLNSSSATFKYGYLNLWQITFTRGLNNDLPLTREYMYRTV